MHPPTKPIGTPDRVAGGGYGGVAYGAALLTEWTESVPELTWPESVRTFGRMRRDAKITAILRAMTLPIIRATWAVDPEGVAREEEARLVAADLGLPVLGERNNPVASPIKGFAWQDHVRMALLSLTYGHMPFEQWFEIREGRTHLAGLQERMPHTIQDVEIGDDGQIVQVIQNTQDRPLPANRLCWYVHEREGANWAGTSLLRPCFTPWVLKHETMRVNATSIRRFGMGIPTVTAPAGATPAQIAEAQRLASGMRAGDEAGAGLPDGYDFRLSGLIGAAPDALGFLEFCDQQITTSALAGIVELGHSSYGSRALGESFLDLFLLALQATADLIGEIATFGSPTMPGVARSLVEYNWGEGEPIPRITCTDVGDRHEITAAAIKMLIDAGAIQPDPVLEEFLRDSWGLPSREQAAGPAGPGAPPGEAAPAGATGAELPNVSPAGPAPAGREATPPDSSTPPAPGPHAGGRRHRRAAGAAPFRRRRELTPVEAAAGLDPDGLLADLDAAAAAVTAVWPQVLAVQRADLAAQVRVAVDRGDLSALARLKAPPAGGPDVLADAMIDMAGAAARRAAAEAAHQRVHIDMSRVRINEVRLRQVAAARAALAGQHLAGAASRKALRVVQATAGEDAAGDVETALDDLNQGPIGDQFRAALVAAQNTGRTAAFTEAEAEGYQGAVYTASEINDANTCPPCAQVDGTEFDSLEAAEDAYANGGFIDCDGELRCRGTFITSWPDDVTIIEPGEEPAEPPPEPEGTDTTDDDIAGVLDYAGDDKAQEILDDLAGRYGGVGEALAAGVAAEVDVDVADLVLAQRVHAETVAQMRARLRAGERLDPPFAVRRDGKDYLVEGGHRALAQLLENRDAETIRIRELELERAQQDDPERTAAGASSWSEIADRIREEYFSAGPAGPVLVPLVYAPDLSRFAPGDFRDAAETAGNTAMQANLGGKYNAGAALTTSEAGMLFSADLENQIRAFFDRTLGGG
jgi:hypothetical protein